MTLSLTTADPAFDPQEPISVNGYRYLPVAQAQAACEAVKSSCLKALKTAQYDPAPYTRGKSAIERVDVEDFVP